MLQARRPQHDMRGHGRSPLRNHPTGRHRHGWSHPDLPRLHRHGRGSPAAIPRCARRDQSPLSMAITRIPRLSSQPKLSRKGNCMRRKARLPTRKSRDRSVTAKSWIMPPGMSWMRSARRSWPSTTDLVHDQHVVGRGLAEIPDCAVRVHLGVGREKAVRPDLPPQLRGAAGCRACPGPGPRRIRPPTGPSARH